MKLLFHTTNIQEVFKLSNFPTLNFKYVNGKSQERTLIYLNYQWD